MMCRTWVVQSMVFSAATVIFAPFIAPQSARAAPAAAANAAQPNSQPSGSPQPSSDVTPASKSPPAASRAGDSSLVARGKYVALAADCMSCHTAPGGQPYAGGEPLKSAFGTIYGPNITPDPKTGIGSWSKADFEKALRLGVSKDGSYLYPAMPYDAYTKMTAADLDALWAFIRTVKPVVNIPPKNTLPFPLTIRSGLAVWQSLYFKPGPFVPNSSKNAVWNRGAYLVQALGHCSDCHTPRNLAQGPETQHMLGGAQIEGWYAPDISDDPASKLHTWNTDQLAKFFKTGMMPDNVKAIGPMQEAIHDSLQYLKDSDLHAIAVYLKDQAAIKPELATKPKWPADRLAAGKVLYENACASCHQNDGKGRPGAVPALANNDSVTSSEPYNVIMAMLEGFPPQGTWGAMGSFAKTLNDDQIADITNYVRTSWGNNALPNATPWSVSTWRKNATPNNESHALLCPSLAPDVFKPALGAGPDALKQAASDRTKMSKLVGDYKTARPSTSSAQVVEALSAAYCQAVASDHISEARMSAQIANFSQRVAEAIGPSTPGPSKPAT